MLEGQFQHSRFRWDPLDLDQIDAGVCQMLHDFFAVFHQNWEISRFGFGFWLIGIGMLTGL